MSSPQWTWFGHSAGRSGARGGRQGLAGRFSVESRLLIDLSAIRGVSLDPQAGLAVVGPQATWGGADQATAALGLVAPGAEVSLPGVVTSSNFRLRELGPKAFAPSAACRFKNVESVFHGWRDFGESE